VKGLEERVLKISRKKTEYFCAIGENGQGKSIKLQDAEIPKVTSYEYLGSMLVQEEGGSDVEVERIKAG